MLPMRKLEQVLMAAGDDLTADGRHNEAANLYIEALWERDDDPAFERQLFLRLAVGHAAMGEFDAAKAAHADALRLSETSSTDQAEVFFELGKTCFAQGWFTKAIENFEKAEAALSDIPASELNIGLRSWINTYKNQAQQDLAFESQLWPYLHENDYSLQDRKAS